MAERHLRAMDLDPDQVGATVRFLRAYANTGLSELDAVLTATEEGSILRDPAFTIAADAATVLREAGQWMLYLDPEQAQLLLSRAGGLFLRLGQPFGAYLVEVAGVAQEELPYQEMLQELAVAQRERDDADVRWPPLRHPQQQAYLMLALTGTPTAQVSSDRVARVLETSTYADGVVPVGALGTPIRRLWDIARHLLARRPESPYVIAGHLTGMARRYEEAMALAQVNRYLWSHGAAAVDVGDIDIAGVTALTARRFGAQVVLGSLEEAGMSAERNPIGMAPIEAGLALAEPTPGDWARSY
jgi:hypothetical protein